MSGIILLAFLTGWFFITKKLTIFFTSTVQSETRKKWLTPFVFTLVFVSPVLDEIIGGFQFRAVCTDKNMLIYDEKSVKNKTLLYFHLSREYVKNTVIPIEKIISAGMDITTEKTLLKRTKYQATGGWLSRFIAFNNITRPYTFHGVCGVKDELSQLERKLNIKATYK
ncbi:MAG: hypothetical protein COB23_10250 [Methylophaga sp.]|nr:MAG: hypothetical protein COB23_10250 [Methylophaga sp.]